MAVVIKKMGASGGVGEKIQDMDNNINSIDKVDHITKIIVWYDDGAIYGFEVFYNNKDSSHGDTGIWGTRKANKKEIPLSPSDRITYIGGIVDELGSDKSIVVRSLKIKINFNIPYEFGLKSSSTGLQFTYDAFEEIIGFHGSSSKDHLDAIGVYMKVSYPESAIGSAGADASTKK